MMRLAIYETATGQVVRFCAVGPGAFDKQAGKGEEAWLLAVGEAEDEDARQYRIVSGRLVRLNLPQPILPAKPSRLAEMEARIAALEATIKETPVA